MNEQHVLALSCHGIADTTSKSFASRLTYGAMLLEADAHVVVEDVRELGLPEAVDGPRISAVTHDAHPVAGLRHQLENWGESWLNLKIVPRVRGRVSTFIWTAD